MTFLGIFKGKEKRNFYKKLLRFMENNINNSIKNFTKKYLT